MSLPLFPERYFWFCFMVFMYILLKKDLGETWWCSYVKDNCRVGYALREFWDRSRSTWEPVGREQGTGLISETGNLPHNKMKNKLNGKLPPCLAPHTFIARCQFHIIKLGARKSRSWYRYNWIVFGRVQYQNICWALHRHLQPFQALCRICLPTMMILSIMCCPCDW